MTDALIQAILNASGELGRIPDKARAHGPYTVMGEVARNAVKAFRGGDTGAFEALFGAIELQLASQSSDTRELLVVGFIEDLQNISMNQGLALDEWTGWLGPRTTQAWDVLKAMWAGNVSPEAFKDFISSGVPPDRNSPPHS